MGGAVVDVVDITDRPTARAAPGQLRVLLVDDDERELAALRRDLDDHHVTIVGSTDSGEHALDLARILDPHIAVIRWNLHRFGGALTARLMRWHAPDVLPVILLDEEDVDELDPGEHGTAFVSVMRHPKDVELTATLLAIGRFWAIVAAASKQGANDAGQGGVIDLRVPSPMEASDRP
jgi:CheY-like chemotaxis protein